MSPKVTVLMPVYNGEKYLRESIDSILNQTFGDFEFLIINDGSNDNSAGIVRSYNDKRINFVENEQNRGLSFSLNKGIDLSNSEYIARMDADDISLPSRLEKQIAFLNKNPNVGICGTWGQFFGESSLIAKTPKSHNKIKGHLFSNCSMLHPTVVFRNNLFKKYNLKYRTDFKIAQDYELWTRASSLINFSNITEVLLMYRINVTQLTSGNNRLLEENTTIWKSILEELDLSLSQEELELHKLFLSEKINNNAFSEIKKLNLWIDKLIQANDKKRIYNKKILLNILHKKYYIALKHLQAGELIPNFKKENLKYLDFEHKFRIMYRLCRQKIKS